MSVKNDQALSSLPKDLGEVNHRYGLRINQVSEEIAGTDRWQLVNVADQNQRCLSRHRLEQVMGQRYIEHRGFIEDQHITFQWVSFVVREPILARIKFE